MDAFRRVCCASRCRRIGPAWGDEFNPVGRRMRDAVMRAGRWPYAGAIRSTLNHHDELGGLPKDDQIEFNNLDHAIRPEWLSRQNVPFAPGDDGGACWSAFGSRDVAAETVAPRRNRQPRASS